MQTAPRLVEVNRQIDMLLRNILVSGASPSLHRMLAELEQEKARLAAVTSSEPIEAEIIHHPVLLQTFKEKVRKLRTALNDDSVRAELIGELIQSIPINGGERPGGRSLGEHHRLAQFCDQ